MSFYDKDGTPLSLHSWVEKLEDPYRLFTTAHQTHSLPPRTRMNIPNRDFRIGVLLCCMAAALISAFAVGWLYRTIESQPSCSNTSTCEGP